MIITGRAYGRRATLDVAGETLTWRAQRGAQPVPENIVTTTHDVREAIWLDQRWSMAGCILAVLGAVWMVTESIPWGAAAIVFAFALVAWRHAHPRLFLVLDLGNHHLVMKVALTSAADGRELVARIDRVHASGEAPASPPTLP